MKEKKFIKLTPFKMQVLQSFPFIDEDFDAITNYELLCKVVEYLNITVDNVNLLESDFKVLYDYVHDYFDNLDVQEEINNKLDEMTEDGTIKNLLAEITHEVHIKDLGAIDDGVTDNSELLQNIFNTYKNIYVDDGVYYSSETLNIPSNVNLRGSGTLKSNISITGTIGDSVGFTSLDKNKITTTHTFDINEMLLIYYEDLSDNTLNKRQIVTTTSTDGKLSNNLINYSNSYTIKTIDSVKNIKINNITIDGVVNISYGQDINIDNITLKGRMNISYSYNVNVENSTCILGNEQRIDCQRASSNILLNNLKVYGGNTVSDNSAIKLNECFYSVITNINLGCPNTGGSYNGTFHGIMLDGNFAEDNYTNNPSNSIYIDKVFIADGYSDSVLITLTNDSILSNINCYKVHIKNSNNIKVKSSKFYYLNNELNNTNLLFSDTIIDLITEGTKSNMTFNNCVIGTLQLSQNVHDIYATNCKITNFTNSYINVNSAYNITLNNCIIYTTCQIAGINKGMFNVVTFCNVLINRLYNSVCEILIADNSTNASTNISIQNSEYNKINYNINNDHLATTPVNIVNTNNYNNDISTISLYKSNNPNNHMTKAILKSNTIPTDTDIMHYKGEIILNNSPASGGFVGWICIANGTPGTWKGFGTIE